MTQGVPKNVDDLLVSRARQTPNKEFLVARFGERRWTYQEFDAAVETAARLIESLGVAKGDRVSLLLNNCAEYLLSYFACFRLGAWAGPVNSLLKSHEIEFIVGNSGSSTVITSPDLLAGLDDARGSVESLENVVVIEPAGDWRIEAGQARGGLQSRRAPVSEDDEAVIIYTSGTTGKPKGVLLTHGNLLANARQIAEWLRLTEQDRALMIMPLFHVNALMTTGLAALWAGGSTVLEPKFSASRHWHTISEHRVTYFGSVATMLSMLNHSYPGGVPADCDIGAFRFALCGSAPVPAEVLKKFEALFNRPVVEGYGLSESTCRSTFNPPDERRRPGSVGLPIGNEVKVVDDNDREVPAGAVGEIVLRGSNIMKGYYRNEAATTEAFRGGWFHTGDLGYRDADGFFYIVDRKSDMIIRAGENIYPREIDEVLYQHPKVQDAATIGVPDELYGEEVKAFIVLRQGSDATEQEIIDFCRARLADFKCPRTVALVKEIPKGPTGKLLKRELASWKPTGGE
jgi:long-chain acyl-CoA synthetase